MKILKTKLFMIDEEEFEFEKILSSKIAVKFLKEIVKINNEPEEIMILICFDNKCKVISYCEVSRGTLTQSLVHPREIFKRAVALNSQSIMLAHNHPSGDCNPSLEDDTFTENIAIAGNILGIRVVDHIIVGKEDYYSYNESNHQLLENDRFKKVKNDNKKNAKKRKIKKNLEI
jgi:DNA repair protein RadC